MKPLMKSPTQDAIFETKKMPHKLSLINDLKVESDTGTQSQQLIEGLKAKRKLLPLQVQGNVFHLQLSSAGGLSGMTPKGLQKETTISNFSNFGEISLPQLPQDQDIGSKPSVLKQKRLNSIRQIQQIYGGMPVSKTPKPTLFQKSIANKSKGQNLTLSKLNTQNSEENGEDIQLTQQFSTDQATSENPQNSFNGKSKPVKKLKKKAHHKKQEEEYSIWDNRDLQYRGIDFEEIEKKDGLQQFLHFYKMRYGGFPGMEEKISNEDVIVAAVNFTKTNKKLFKKYFPSKQVIFEDNADYAEDHPLNQDQNFQKFLNYVKDIQSTGGGEVSAKRRMVLPSILDPESVKKLQARIKRTRRRNQPQ